MKLESKVLYHAEPPLTDLWGGLHNVDGLGTSLI